MDFRQVAVFKERKLREENEELKEKIKKLEEENFDLGAKVDFIKEKGTCGFCQYLDNKKLQELTKENFDLKARVEELESQNDYECECNKDFVAYQNENERLKEILACAVNDLYFHNYTREDIIESLEITEEEYNKYMGE